MVKFLKIVKAISSIGAFAMGCLFCFCILAADSLPLFLLVVGMISSVAAGVFFLKFYEDLGYFIESREEDASE